MLTTADERRAHLADHPEDQTSAAVINKDREKSLVHRALPLIAADFDPTGPAAFGDLYFAIEQAAHGDPEDTAYLDAIGMDRVWVMTDKLLKRWKQR